MAPENNNSESWFDDYQEGEDGSVVDNYDITSVPNDFNLLTIASFIESGAIIIPGFQRNYVWDIQRASKLIESLILGLPVPQIFLYEESRNTFLVIDGQQRLMSIYYFMKQRFPRKEKRVELRSIFKEYKRIPVHVLEDDTYFQTFSLKLKTPATAHINKFHGVKYNTLNEHKTGFDLRTIRNVVVKQISPQEDDSAMYEIFNRLNTGGINLKPQEIRASLNHSDFYELLDELNSNETWRGLLSLPDPSQHMKDIEILLRGFAFLLDADSYRPSLVRFLNEFSKKARKFSKDKLIFLSDLFESFMDECDELGEDIFISSRTNRFNIALFEAVFAAACMPAISQKSPVSLSFSLDQIRKIENDKSFIDASAAGTTKKSNVEARINAAKKYIS